MGPKLLIVSLNYRTPEMTLRSVQAALREVSGAYAIAAALRDSNTGQLQQSRYDVDQFNQCVVDNALANMSRPGADQGHPYQTLVKTTALADELVVAKQFAVVGSEDH